MLHVHLFSSAIFLLTTLLKLLTACLHPSHGLTAQGFLFLHPYFVHLSNAYVNQYQYLTLVNSGILLLYLFFHLPMT